MTKKSDSSGIRTGRFRRSFDPKSASLVSIFCCRLWRWPFIAVNVVAEHDVGRMTFCVTRNANIVVILKYLYKRVSEVINFPGSTIVQTRHSPSKTPRSF